MRAMGANPASRRTRTSPNQDHWPDTGRGPSLFSKDELADVTSCGQWTRHRSEKSERAGDPTEAWPDIRLPAGTAAELIDADRREA